jgi:hypothetical protein
MISSKFEMRSMEGYRSGLGKADFFEWVCFHFVEKRVGIMPWDRKNAEISESANQSSTPP